MKAKSPREGDIILQPIKRRLEGLIGGEFGDDVMVIGVEPFCHFHSRDVAAAIASCHSEVGVESGACIPKTMRNGSQRDSQIKNMIVERKVAHSDERKPCVMLNLPMSFFQLICRIAELPFGKFSFPVPLKGFFEFAFSPDTGKPQNVRLHCVSLSTVEVEKSTTYHLRKRRKKPEKAIPASLSDRETVMHPAYKASPGF